MLLRGIPFPRAMNASGARGFYGERYQFQGYWPIVGFSWQGAGLVGKTLTLERRLGNMPMRKDGITPREFFPRCIIVKINGHVLNAVDLSNPGLPTALESGRYQQLTEPFFLNFTAVSVTKEERLEEWRGLVALILRYRDTFRAPYGLQHNFSCPNTGHVLESFYNEVGEVLQITGALRVPNTLKFNALLPVAVGLELARHEETHAICMGNTIPWGALPDDIDWFGLFGSRDSPLQAFGGGGLSGPQCLAPNYRWIEAAKAGGCPIPLIACNGIRSVKDCQRVLQVADGYELGTAAIFAPHRLQLMIRYGLSA